MKGRIIADWTRVNITDPQCRAKMLGALNHWLLTPQENVEIRRHMQHFATRADFPASVLEIIEKFHLTTNFDNGYERFFALRDYTSSNRNGFHILDVAHGLTFEEIPEGGEVKIGKMAGAKVTVNFAMYGGGLGWHRTLFDDKEYWDLEDNAIAFNNAFYLKKAQVFYALIQAIGSGTDVAWQAAAPAVATTDANYLALRDMATINLACLNILTSIKDKGYGITAQTQFELLAPLAIRPRINRALGLLNANVAGQSLRGVEYNINPNYSLMLDDTTDYYVGVSGIKNIIGNRMNLQVFDQFDPRTYSDIAVGWARYGGAIGDTDQIRRCKTA